MQAYCTNDITPPRPRTAIHYSAIVLSRLLWSTSILGYVERFKTICVKRTYRTDHHKGNILPYFIVIYENDFCMLNFKPVYSMYYPSCAESKILNKCISKSNCAKGDSKDWECDKIAIDSICVHIDLECNLVAISMSWAHFQMLLKYTLHPQ